jgi:hypothetical protein
LIPQLSAPATFQPGGSCHRSNAEERSDAEDLGNIGSRRACPFLSALWDGYLSSDFQDVSLCRRDVLPAMWDGLEWNPHLEASRRSIDFLDALAHERACQKGEV